MLRLSLFGLLLSPTLAAAHTPTPGESHLGWYAVIMFNLTVLTFLYVRGWKSKDKSGTRPLLLFLSAILSILLALLPPIDTLSDQLLSVHMVQHMLLMMVGAPLFVFAFVDYNIKLGMSHSIRRIVWKISRKVVGSKVIRLSRPLAIALLYALILWIWHLKKT